MTDHKKQASVGSKDPSLSVGSRLRHKLARGLALLSPAKRRARTQWLTRDGVEFLRAVGIGKGDAIIDFGCGPGAYSIPAALLVGNDGLVVSVDIGVYSTVLGDSAFAVAGLTTSQALEKGYDIITGESEAPNRHPGCMPGGAPLKVRLLFETGSQILIGGQVTGAKSGGELINAISACIHQRMTADDIATFQTGTHPALTASPIAYQLVNAAEIAIGEIRKRKGV